MWLVGPTVEVLKQLYPAYSTYNEITFPTYHMFSKISLIFVQLGLTIFALYLLETILKDYKKAFLIIALFSFEPFFIGNSRVLHLDILLTLLLFNGLLLSYLHLKKFSWWQGILAGIFFGLSFLTKSVGIGGVLFASGVGGLYWILRRNYGRGIKYALSLIVPAFLTTLVLLPALWVDPTYVLTQIYEGIANTGILKGHNEIFFGEYTRNPGILFYPVILLIKTSPFMLLGLLVALIKANWRRMKQYIVNMDIAVFLSIFYIGYFVVMTIGAKKIDRYMLPMFPFLAVLVTLGLFSWREVLTKRFTQLVLAILLGVSFIMPMFKLFPYYFTYTNPLFGAPQFVHENIVAQKPFGVGMFEVTTALQQKYQCAGNVLAKAHKPTCVRYPPVAFLDPKPMFWLYDKGQVKYTKIDGTSSYRLLVLGVNEEIPEKVSKSSYDFKHSESIYINGLEYWKIYVRSDKEVK